MPTVLHHQHMRKRKGQYPHPDFNKRVLDKIVYAVGVIQPLTTIPQVYKIWIGQQAGGISLFTYVSYILFDCIWIWYGVVHREKPIVIMYILWIILNTSIAIGALLYG